MKKYLSLICCFLGIIGCSETQIEKIGIDDVTGQINYQDSLLIKKSDSALFRTTRLLISQYRELEEEKIIDNPNYNYYLARLYSQISNITPNFFYDSTTNIIKNENLYKVMYDSSIYFSNRTIQLQPKNIQGYYRLAYSLFYDCVRNNASEFGDKNIYPAFKKRNVSSYSKMMTLLNSNLDNIYKIDTSSNNILSKSIVEIALKLNFYDLMDANNGSISNTTLNQLNDNDLKNIISFSNHFKKIEKNDTFVFISNSNRNNFQILSSFSNDCSKIFNERHAWDNVVADLYSNVGCDNLWIYSNGRYTQELYEQDISMLPRHEAMELTSYDLMHCNIKGLQKLIKHRSRGKWTKKGSTYIFYPDSPDQYILSGTDENGQNYMYLNSYGNLEYHRTSDYEKVVLINKAKNCKECVTVGG